MSNTASGRNWMPDNIKERNADSPGLNIEYSILEIGDNIRKRSKAAEFEVHVKRFLFIIRLLIVIAPFFRIFLEEHI